MQGNNVRFHGFGKHQDIDRYERCHETDWNEDAHPCCECGKSKDAPGQQYFDASMFGENAPTTIEAMIFSDQPVGPAPRLILASQLRAANQPEVAVAAPQQGPSEAGINTTLNP
ncbi:hypothetical protein TKK_0003679 [Trichogramma kaykai]|uniref:Uncharacterized protein n=1 Tax=Trichogramma kaykai TaxID=54128 RepID=A0ABD2XNJ2_9HYME